jgi:hypothetical protein
MVSIEKRIDAFGQLGQIMSSFKSGKSRENSSLNNVIKESNSFNPWFTKENVRNAIINIGGTLTPEKLKVWAEKYLERLHHSPGKRVGVVMAGNIPLVGFHDFLCVILSGNKIIARLSSDDNKLLPEIAAILIDIDPAFKDQISFTEHKLENFEAVIATGSNNSSRYFEYYFRNVPHIIRKSRNGIAVLIGDENDEDLKLLGEDIFLYFGMGCRSVAKIFVPKYFSFNKMFESFREFKSMADHPKYINNYEYYKSIFLINGHNHFDNGFLLLKEDITYSSPPAVLYFEEYENLQNLNYHLLTDHDQIQCIVSRSQEINGAIPFGCAQKPELWDYADGIDTMEFLLKL